MSPQKEKEVDSDRHREIDAWEREREAAERDKEREREVKEARDKRQSKEIAALDHRGSSGVINIVEHQTNSQDRRTNPRREMRSSKDAAHNGNNGNVPSGNSSITNISTSPQKVTPHRMANGGGLNSVIFPLLTDVSTGNENPFSLFCYENVSLNKLDLWGKKHTLSDRPERNYT